MAKHQNEREFAKMVGGFDPAVRDLAQRTRALVLDVMPGAWEVVWPRQRVAGYGTGPRKMSEHFCWVSPHKAHVDLGFYYGAELPDPANLLEGTGRLLRHVKLRSVEDVEQEELRRLVEVATTHRVPPLREP